MMLVPLNIHRLTYDKTEVPTQELVDFFSAFGISLQTREIKDSIDSNPVDKVDYKLAVDSILHQTAQPPKPGDPAHLIVGSRWIDNPNVNGMLLDTNRRGFAAVFTQSADLIGDGNDKSLLLQTMVHEIGHMLNLIHSDAAPEIPTAMCQAGVRFAMLAQIADAWTKCHLHQPPKVYAFPFGMGEKDRLTWPNLDEVRPWGTSFRGMLSGDTDDYDRQPLRLHVRTERKRHAVGGQVALIVELVNHSGAKCQIPAYLDPAANTLRITITRPNGKSYIHRPRFSICCDAAQTMAAGARAAYPLLIVDGPGGTVLPTPGRYQIQVTAPFVRERAAPVEIEAINSGPEVFSDPVFQRFVSDGAPRWRHKEWDRLNALLNDVRRSRSPDLAHLAFLLAKQVNDPAKANELLAVAERDYAPRKVRHAAFLHRKKCLEPLASEFVEIRAQAAKAYPDNLLDHTLHRSLETMEATLAAKGLL
jgi:hypothetical protein